MKRKPNVKFKKFKIMIYIYVKESRISIIIVYSCFKNINNIKILIHYLKIIKLKNTIVE